MKNKYNMTKEDNIFFAKRKIIDNIYKSANLEGIAITFTDTCSFCNNINPGNISIDDVLILKGLKDGWQFILKNIDAELTIDYIKNIYFEIYIYKDLQLPSEYNYEEELKEILNITGELERCITLFCWIQRSQMFLDGNKRVANLIANKEMIKNGQGIIAVPVEKIGEYTTQLIKYYETNDMTDIKMWIYNNCIDGI